MTHRLTWLQTWMVWLGVRRPAELPATARVEEQPVCRLRKILVVVVRFPGVSGLSEQLLVDRMSPDCMLFRTRGDLGEGEALEVQVLVPGFGSLVIGGSIAWLRPTENGCLHGELQLQTLPHQRQILADFLARDARGHR